MISRGLHGLFKTYQPKAIHNMSIALAETPLPADSDEIHTIEVVELVQPTDQPNSATPLTDELNNPRIPCDGARKRPPSPDLRLPSRRKKNLTENLDSLENVGDVKYYFENGLRKVEPYYYTWKTYAKGRWLGRTMEDVFRDEFLSLNEDVTEARIRAEPCNFFVNGVRANMQHKFRNNDFVAHYMHRHEAPVTAQPIKIVAETENMLAVDKPSSIPVHPCGRFRMNSVCNILASETGRRNLRIVHRLDRLTSGLLIFSKNLATSQGVQEQMADRSVRKEYLARVAGRFPDGHVVCEEPIDCVNVRAGIYQVRPTGRHCVTGFDRLSYDPVTDTSIVHCKPRTGRTHQIRVHLQHMGYAIANDPYYGPKSTFTGNPAIELEDARLGEDFTEECQRQRFSKFEQLPDHPWTDPKCPECWINYTDPLPEDMRIDLHAWKYEGPGWKFETDAPFWAKDVAVPVSNTCAEQKEPATAESTSADNACAVQAAI